MFPFFRLGRRKFLRDFALSLGAAPWLARASQEWKPTSSSQSQTGQVTSVPKVLAQFGSTERVWIVHGQHAGFAERLAARELARGLRNLGLAREPALVTIGEGDLPATEFQFFLCRDPHRFQHPEAYEISHVQHDGNPPCLRIVGATPQAVLYGVFDFLEQQGAFFGLDGEVYPLEPTRALNLPPPNVPWRAQPRFKVRGLMPWPDFLNCVTVYNREDWRAYLEAMVRMRFNTLGVHVYSGEKQWAESFLSFEYAGAGHLAYTDTTATNRWGYLPERTSRYGMGSADFFAGDVFGADATTQARDCWEAQEMAGRLWRQAFEYAKLLGIRTGVGFEPYQVPDEIFRAVPPEAHYKSARADAPGPRIDPESVAARDILEARLGRLLEAYPSVDYVWLWEDEDMSWASQKGIVPLSVTPFRQAYDFLKRHAPEKRLVISGWGGVVRHFANFHKALPADIIFSSLNDDLGWNPVSEEYGKLEGRERWPIPWLEDDSAMWLPQFHVSRFVRDMNLAERYGCQGLLGIHWRHRIVDANAGFQSRYSWDRQLTPKVFFQAFALAQTREPRAQKLASVLEETDRERLILCSWTGEVKDGHSELYEYSDDSEEAFQFWGSYEPSEALKKSQANVARELRALTDAASSPAERERLNYLARFVEFLSPYAESWSLATHLNQKLAQANDLKKQKKAAEARELILREGVPLWLNMASRVREAVLDFQEIVSTRNDQGQLASMHNKYERLAFYRLPASLKEFLGVLPPEIERRFADLSGPNLRVAARAFVPTRTTMLREAERVRIYTVVPGAGEVRNVSLFTRSNDGRGWSASVMRLLQRRTFVGEIQGRELPGPLLDYYVAAEVLVSGARKTLTAPLEAPLRHYTVTLI